MPWKYTHPNVRCFNTNSENGENRTVLLLGEFGTSVTDPPVEVKLWGFIYNWYFIWRSACSAINLNGSRPRMLFRCWWTKFILPPKIHGNLNECNSGTQTFKLSGMVALPFINGDIEYDLFQYYVGYSDSSGF